MRLAFMRLLASLYFFAISVQLVDSVDSRLRRLHQPERTRFEQQRLLAMDSPQYPEPVTGPDTVRLSDVIGRDRSINVFAGFARGFASVSNRFDSRSQNSTVLAPLNSAIEALPRKPWEDPQDYHKFGVNAYEGGNGQERAQRNLRRFVEAHVIERSPWAEKTKSQSLMDGDQPIWWEMNSKGVRVIQPGNIEVISIASTVANGQVWIIKGVRNYSS